MRWWILGILLCGCVGSEEEFTTQLRIESPPPITQDALVGEFDGGVDLGQTF